MKQEFKIPENSGKMIISQQGNKFTIEFKSKFKKGDILINKNGQVYILQSIGKNNEAYYYAYVNTRDYDYDFVGGGYYSCGYVHDARLANKEEKQILFDTLKQEGKRWNEKALLIEIEKLCVGDLVIAWNNDNKGLAIIGKIIYIDDNITYQVGHGYYTNAIKFESIEQFENLINNL